MTNAKLKIFVILNNCKRKNSKVKTRIIIAIRKKKIRKKRKGEENEI